MIRFTKALAVASVALLLPTVSSALGISIVGAPVESGTADGIIEVGETITFDLVMENSGGVNVTALDVIAFGYDVTPDTSGARSSGLTNVGGSLAGAAFQIPIDIGGGTIVCCAEGVQNLLTAPTDLFQVNNINPEVVRTQLFGGLAGLPGYNGDGQGDLGNDGATRIADGGIHFQVTFENIPTQLAVSNITMEFGTNAALGAVATDEFGAVPFNNATFALTVIPEPGTALLMGLGLAGLAASGRRR